MGVIPFVFGIVDFNVLWINELGQLDYLSSSGSSA